MEISILSSHILTQVWLLSSTLPAAVLLQTNFEAHAGAIKPTPCPSCLET